MRSVLQVREEELDNSKRLPYYVFYQDIISERQFYDLKAVLIKSPEYKTYKERIKELATKLILDYKAEPFNKSAGIRRVYREAIPAELKKVISKNLVYKIMTEHDLLVPTYRKGVVYSSYEGMNGKEPENIINYNFFGNAPLEKLYTDVSMFLVKLTNRTRVRVYFSPVLDSYNNEIVAFYVGLLAQTEYVITEPLNSLLKNFSKEIRRLKHLGVPIIFHSDQGSQNKSEACVKALEDMGYIQSMSEKGQCNQNACAESLFGRFKEIIISHKNFAFESVEALIKTIKATIYYWNYQRTVERLGTTPIEARKAYNNLNGLGAVTMTEEMQECRRHYHDILAMKVPGQVHVTVR